MTLSLFTRGLAALCVAGVCGGSLDAQGTRWILEARPTIDITEFSEDLPLGRIAGAVTLRDGSIVVGDASSLQLFFFSKDGKPRSAFGRDGEGPGEFRALQSVSMCGADTLAVLDLRLSRVTRVDANGKLASVARTRPERGYTPGNRPNPYQYVCGSGGAQAITGGPTIDFTQAQPVGPYRGVVDIGIAKPGAPFTRLGTFAGPDRYRHTNADGPVVFGRNVHVAVSQTRVFVGTADSFFVQVFDLDGAPKGTIRRAVPVRQVRPADRARYKEQVMQRMTATGPQRAALMKRFDEVYLPPVFAAHERLLVDDQNHLWVEEGHAPSEPMRQWWGFQADGTPIGSMRVPDAFELYEIRGSTVLGKWTDADGAESVRGYRLTRAR